MPSLRLLDKAMIMIANNEKLSRYRLYIQPAIIAILSIALTFVIIHDNNKPTREEIALLKADNENLTERIDSVERERKQKDISFSRLQKNYSVDSTRLARAIITGDSFKLLYLSLNKQHAYIHRNTRNLSVDSLQMYWTELTR